MTESEPMSKCCWPSPGSPCRTRGHLVKRDVAPQVHWHESAIIQRHRLQLGKGRLVSHPGPAFPTPLSCCPHPPSAHPEGHRRIPVWLAFARAATLEREGSGSRKRDMVGFLSRQGTAIKMRRGRGIRVRLRGSTAPLQKDGRHLPTGAICMDEWEAKVLI